MCAAVADRSVPYRPARSFPVPNRRLSRWSRRAANDNRLPVPPYRFALLLTGTALIWSFALLAVLLHA